MDSGLVNVDMILDAKRSVKESVNGSENTASDVRLYSRNNGLTLKKSDSDESSASSLDDSIIDEYWEDFDIENHIKEEKKKVKFLNLDDPDSISLNEMSKREQNLFKDFDPENPPLLDYYEELKKKYKLPSRTLLELERDGYRKYIKMMKKVAKILVKRAKAQARNTARKIIINHAGSARVNFDKEVINILLQHEGTKNENTRFRKRISDLEDKLLKNELTLAQTANYFRKREIDFDTKDEPESESEDGMAKHLLTRRARRRGVNDLQVVDKNPKTRVDIGDLIISKPLNFYSMYIKISNEDKDELFQSLKVRSLKRKVCDQQEHIERTEEDLNSISKELKNILSEENQKREELEKVVSDIKLEAETTKVETETDRNDKMAEIQQEMQTMAYHMKNFRDIASQEVKINEEIRFKQRMQIHKLKNDMKQLK